MHLAVDAVGAKFGGGVTVLLDFLDAALTDKRITKISVFSSPRVFRRFDLPLTPKLTEIEVSNVEQSRVRRLLWPMYELGVQCTKIGADVILCLGNIGQASIPTIVLIQQSLPFSAEAMATRDIQRRFEMTVIKYLMAYSCRKASYILVQTPVMLKNVQTAFGVEDSRISYVLPTAQLPSAEIQPDNPVIGLFHSVPQSLRLLYVGSDGSYKMLPTIINGLTLLRKTIPQATLFLTLPSEHPYSQIEGVICCGYLVGAALRFAYEAATALVMPSLTETVGLPMLEALSVGTPVIAADRPYAHVICEDAAVFFDPLCAEDFAAAATNVLQSTTLHAELSRAANRLTQKRSIEQPYARMVEQLIAFAPLNMNRRV